MGDGKGLQRRFRVGGNKRAGHSDSDNFVFVGGRGEEDIVEMVKAKVAVRVTDKNILRAERSDHEG